MRGGWGPSYPSYFTRAAGPHLWDDQGKRYIDWVLGKGPITLGHAFAEVDQAAAARASKGMLFPGAPLEYEEVAGLLAAITPVAEKTAFTKNGSDAVLVAMRFARVATGRPVILSCGYHGWDERLLGGEQAPDDGAVGAARRVYDFGYDLALLERLLAKSGANIAGVVVTPEPAFLDEEWMRRCQAITRAAKALFIVDEVRCGMRVAWGGMHELASLRPDMVVFSKGLANGYPLAAVSGPAEVLDASRRTYVFGTFYAEAQALAASAATLKAARARDTVGHMGRVGSSLARGLDDLFAAHGVAACTVGPPQMLEVVFESDAVEAAFFEGAAAGGVLFFQEDFQSICLAHGEAEVKETLEVCARVMPKVAALVPKVSGRGADALSDAALRRHAHRRMLRDTAIDVNAMRALVAKAHAARP
jgi:glutamate-1-semialdehyde aminotransferase